MAQIRLSQKQLQTLNRQLYGKSLEAKKTTYSAGPSLKTILADKTPAPNYLKTDLLKIVGFSFAALLIQFVFYLGIQYQLIKF